MIAQKLGGDLLSLNTAEEERRVSTLPYLRGGFPQGVWLGLSDKGKEGKFFWVDGTAVTYAAWGAEEPNSTDPEADFVTTQLGVEKRDWRVIRNMPYTRIVLIERTNSPSELKPIMLREPAPITMRVGSMNELSAHFVSPNPLQYQWRFNGVDLPNETNQTMSLTGTATNQTGLYDIVARNANGSVTSNPVEVTVFLPMPPKVEKSALVRLEDGRVVLQITHDYPDDALVIRLEESEDFENWTRVDDNSVLFDPPQFQVSIEDLGHRFFRLRRYSE